MVPTPTKPAVDASPYQWSHDGQVLDLFEAAQQPYQAQLWRQRREHKDCADAARGKASVFTKLDLTSLIVSKRLQTKDAVLAYVQQHGTVSMQSYVSRVQRKLDEHLQDAWEWAKAQASADEERLSGWDIVCAAAAKTCPHGDHACSYWQAAQSIFERNRATLCPRRLACAIRNVIMAGPSKQNRVPFLVGPSNSGKSTLVYPFDELFSPQKVLHKPALGSTFALRNITKKRRQVLAKHHHRPRIVPTWLGKGWPPPGQWQANGPPIAQLSCSQSAADDWGGSPSNGRAWVPRGGFARLD